MTRAFYVYEHWRPDIDVCFYVGKGHGIRANDMRRSRNRHHLGIQKKLYGLGMCVEVRMVAEDLSEDRALKIECERIAFWLAAGVKLANQTSGGDGLKNPSESVRKRLAEAAVKHHTGRVHSEAEKAKRRAAVAEARKNDPSIIERIRAAAKAQWADPTKRKTITESIREASKISCKKRVRDKAGRFGGTKETVPCEE